MLPVNDRRAEARNDYVVGGRKHHPQCICPLVQQHAAERSRVSAALAGEYLTSKRHAIAPAEEAMTFVHGRKRNQVRPSM